MWSHVEGNHATLVSFPLPVTQRLGAAAAAACALAQDAIGETVTPLYHEALLHLSVSRTFPLTRTQVAPFTAAMCRALGVNAGE